MAFFLLSKNMLPRFAKIALVACSSVFLLLVVFGNLTDYGSNFGFVEHVLSMDTTFPGNHSLWRAITTPALHHLFYATIIFWEAVSGSVIGVGAWRMWQARGASAATWRKAKGLATAGLTLSLLQWYLAFIIVGGEWFQMWQSKTWNGQDAAFRMFAIVGLSLIFLNLRDEELDAS